MAPPDASDRDVRCRIDRWLWAARFFKTRPLSVGALECGRVLCNGVRARPAKALAVGDMLLIRIDPHQYTVEVLVLSDKRGPALQAQTLYRETEDSRARRKTLSDNLKLQPVPVSPGGRPTKRDRREIEKLKDGAW